MLTVNNLYAFVQDKSLSHFGLLVAYVLPGFIALVGIAPLFPIVGRWLQPVSQGDFGLGPPVYAVLGATAAGMILSCFRWVLLDNVHQLLGIRRPIWDDRQLSERLRGFDYLVQNHFRFYEFAGNTLLAVVGAYGANRLLGTLPFLGFGTDLGVLILSLVLFAASRDALAKYYTRTGRLVGHVAEKELRGEDMYNGNDHGGGHKEASPKQADESKPQQKPETPEKSKPTERAGEKRSQ